MTDFIKRVSAGQLFFFRIEHFARIGFQHFAKPVEHEGGGIDLAQFNSAHL